MGFFSWKTADTKESIYNNSTDHCQTVYMLRPDNTPIKEDSYEGYGVFGGIDAYVLLAQMNAAYLKLEEKGIRVNFNDEDLIEPPASEIERLREIGIAMDVGDFLEHRDTKEVLHVLNDNRALVDGEYFKGNYGEVIPKYGKSANDMIQSGELITRPFSHVLDLPFTLKFSFDQYADYHALPASETCPHQGYFDSLRPDDDMCP